MVEKVLMNEDVIDIAKHLLVYVSWFDIPLDEEKIADVLRAAEPIQHALRLEKIIDGEFDSFDEADENARIVIQYRRSIREPGLYFRKDGFYDAVALALVGSVHAEFSLDHEEHFLERPETMERLRRTLSFAGMDIAHLSRRPGPISDEPHRTLLRTQAVEYLQREMELQQMIAKKTGYLVPPNSHQRLGYANLLLAQCFPEDEERREILETARENYDVLLRKAEEGWHLHARTLQEIRSVYHDLALIDPKYKGKAHELGERLRKN